MARAIADLEQTLARRAAAAGEAIPAVLAGELDAVLLEPGGGSGSLAGQPLDEPAVGGLVRALPDVFRVLFGGVVVAERSLDPSLRLRRVAGLERSFGHERDARIGLLGGDGSRETGGAASDHEHVDCEPFAHAWEITLIQEIRGAYA